MSDGDKAKNESDPRQGPDAAYVIGGQMGMRSKIINAVLLLLVLGLSVSWVVLMSGLPRIEGVMPITGIRQSATIARDYGQGAGVERIRRIYARRSSGLPMRDEAVPATTE